MGSRNASTGALQAWAGSGGAALSQGPRAAARALVPSSALPSSSLTSLLTPPASRFAPHTLPHPPASPACRTCLPAAAAGEPGPGCGARLLLAPQRAQRVAGAGPGGAVWVEGHRGAHPAGTCGTVGCTSRGTARGWYRTRAAARACAPPVPACLPAMLPRAAPCRAARASLQEPCPAPVLLPRPLAPSAELHAALRLLRTAPVPQLYTESTDGSFIEAKESALVWHYRDADPDFGSWQVRPAALLRATALGLCWAAHRRQPAHSRLGGRSFRPGLSRCPPVTCCTGLTTGSCTAPWYRRRPRSCWTTWRACFPMSPSRCGSWEAGSTAGPGAATGLPAPQTCPHAASLPLPQFTVPALASRPPRCRLAALAGGARADDCGGEASGRVQGQDGGAHPARPRLPGRPHTRLCAVHRKRPLRCGGAGGGLLGG